MLRLLWLVAICSATERVSISFRLQPLHNANDPIKYLPFTINFIQRGETNQTEGLAYKIDGQNYFYGIVSMPLGEHSPYWKDLTAFELGFPKSHYLQKSVAVWMKNGKTTHFKLTTDEYKLHVTGAAYNYTAVGAKTKTEDGLGSCNCVKKNCACCVHVKLPELKFQHELCTNISYNAESIGLDVSIGVDGHYVTWEVSARNPPPICFDVPGTREIAAACLKFEHLDVTKKHVAGCMEVELELIRMRVAHAPLGCFDMPI